MQTLEYSDFTCQYLTKCLAPAFYRTISQVLVRGMTTWLRGKTGTSSGL